MPNPFANARWFHRAGHVTNTTVWRMLPVPNGYAVITTIGRKSGKQRARTIRAVRDGRTLYAAALLAERSSWVHNIRANPAIRIKLGARTYDAKAREIVDPSERARAAEAYRSIVGWYDWADYANFAWDIPTRAKLLRAHDKWFDSGTPVAFDIDAS